MVRPARPPTLLDHAVDAADPAFVAGVDEVGRGPLAGPVVAAAVVLDLRAVPEGVADSKVLTPARREALFEVIAAGATISVASVPAARIDAIGIRAATFEAMAAAVRGLSCRVEGVLVDGLDVPPGLPCPGRAIVGGDALVAAISAASIVAKVARDRMMAALAARHAGYGFERHKGYGTAEHLSALDRLGPCPLHRRSFAPVARAADRSLEVSRAP